MSKKVDIVIAGVGGQGTILAGKLISTLALMEGLDVKSAETHGMAQRGGSVITHLRMGEKVSSPLVPAGEADFLLSFERLEALRWLPFLSPRGTVIVNSQMLAPLPVLTGDETYPEDVLDRIRDKAARTLVVDGENLEPARSNPRTLNILLIGVLAGLLPFARESWESALKTSLPPHLHQVNLEALEVGFALYK